MTDHAQHEVSDEARRIHAEWTAEVDARLAALLAASQAE